MLSASLNKTFPSFLHVCTRLFDCVWQTALSDLSMFSSQASRGMSPRWGVFCYSPCPVNKHRETWHLPALSLSCYHTEPAVVWLHLYYFLISSTSRQTGPPKGPDRSGAGTASRSVPLVCCQLWPQCDIMSCTVCLSSQCDKSAAYLNRFDILPL